MCDGEHVRARARKCGPVTRPLTFPCDSRYTARPKYPPHTWYPSYAILCIYVCTHGRMPGWITRTRGIVHTYVGTTTRAALYARAYSYPLYRIMSWVMCFLRILKEPNAKSSRIPLLAVWLFRSSGLSCRSREIFTVPLVFHCFIATELRSFMQNSVSLAYYAKIEVKREYIFLVDDLKMITLKSQFFNCYIDPL